MSEQVKNIDNYNPQSVTGLDENLNEFTLYSIPMRLFLYQGKLILTVEVYKREQFNQGLPSNSRFNRSFELNYSDAKTQFPVFFEGTEDFEGIESSFFDWLGISGNDYALEMLDINLTNLQFRGLARHKTRPLKTAEDATVNYEDFEAVKAAYPDLVPAYFMFARTLAATNAKLALFN